MLKEPALPAPPVFDPAARHVPAETLERLQAFADNWYGKVGNEQQLSQSFLRELCHALGVPPPYTGEIPEEDYTFESPVAAPGGSSRGRIDLYFKDHFILEAKCGRSNKSEPGSAPVRGSKAYVDYIKRAYLDQAHVYASLLPEPPPILIVVDVGWHFWIWRGFDGQYQPFHSPDRLDIPLDRIADEDMARVLLYCFEDPNALDPARYQARISEEAAEQIATLAKDLGDSGHDPEVVARFLMRCLFCMFAEDVDLLPAGHFTKLLVGALHRPELFQAEATRLFRVMDKGGDYNWENIRCFNGALFQDAEALPLDAKQVRVLADASALNWAHVDPAIFGTLLERALDPEERHRLGAHFTPRRYVERVVRAAVEEPLRAEWELVQARAHEVLEEEGGEGSKAQKAAQGILEAFLERLNQVRVLDPACGTGNFLYISYALLKGIEHEVMEELATLGGAQEGLALEGESVVPEHFLGIEVKEWAAEIAQLVLWIGHLQWKVLHLGLGHVRDPVLSPERSIQCRDALIDWDKVRPRTDTDGHPVLRWDGHSTKVHPVTGKDVPDESKMVQEREYIGVRQSSWPRADFVVGNPPFIGNKRMRELLGDAYAEAVRGAYPDVPKTVDFVMYWWHRAADLCHQGELRRFGLICTNSLRQTQNRQVLEAHMKKDPPLRLVMAIPDHPWVDDGADVRISMTVAQRSDPSVQALARRGEVEEEGKRGKVKVEVPVAWRAVRQIHADLSSGPALSSAVKLEANVNVSFQGMNLVGKGFRLSREQVIELGYHPSALPPVIRPYLNTWEMMHRSKDRFVIDAFGLSAEELKERHPSAYQWLFDYVKPERDHNRRPSRKRNWWLFGETVGKLRRRLAGLQRYIVTPETSKHRVFQFLDVVVCPDHKLYAIVLDDAYYLGVLSSRAHVLWATSAGGRQGIGNDPTYNNTRCFLTYPFPVPSKEQRAVIAGLAEDLDAYRKRIQAEHPEAELTKMYNLLAKLRAGKQFTKKDRELHLKVGTDELRRLHDELDSAVTAVYGWPVDLSDEDLLERLVALNAERAAEEAAGTVRWLRPEYDTGKAAPARQYDLITTKEEDRRPAWPAKTDPVAQLAAVLGAVQAASGPMDAEAVASNFHNAPRQRVTEIMTLLAAQRLIVDVGGGAFQALRMAV